MPATSYPIDSHQLDNGMRVVISPDHGVPVAAVNLWYDVGSRDEVPGQYGWAHLFEHLMFAGSAHVTSGEHLHLMQSVGGAVNATTWFDRTNYFETVPIGALDLALWLEADRLSSLADHLAADSVATQQQVVKEEKRQRYDNVPYGQAMTRLSELVFGADHPYGHTTIGSMADIDAATAASVADFFRAHYRPDNAVLTIVGDITVRDGFKRAQKAFGRISREPGPDRAPSPELGPIPSLRAATESDPVPAAAGYLGWRLPARDTADFDACDLALAILGGGQSSRLHQRLVRDQQVASAASSQALGLIGGNSIGLLSVRALPGQPAAPAIDSALAELERFLADGPSEAELARAKAQYTREWLTELAHLDSRADLISAYATLHRDPDRINRRLAEVTAIGRDQVQASAARWLQPRNRAQLDYAGGGSDEMA